MIYFSPGFPSRLIRPWKLPVDKKRLIIFVTLGTRIDAQSFSKDVGIGSSLHCLLGRDCNRCYMSVSNVSWTELSDTGSRK